MSLEEQWKYEKAYELTHYRMGGVRYEYTIKDIASMVVPSNLLDVGCGRGEILDFAEGRGITAQGIETVPALCDGDRVIHGDICAIPFEDNAFDYVTCYDVLEHLPPGTEQKALDELGRVCNGVLYISTNDRPSSLPDGTDLHINKRPQHEWHADIARRWGEDNMNFTFRGRMGDWHWQIMVS